MKGPILIVITRESLFSWWQEAPNTIKQDSKKGLLFCPSWDSLALCGEYMWRQPKSQCSISFVMYCLSLPFFWLIRSLAGPTLAAFIVRGPLHIIATRTCRLGFQRTLSTFILCSSKVTAYKYHVTILRTKFFSSFFLKVNCWLNNGFLFGLPAKTWLTYCNEGLVVQNWAGYNANSGWKVNKSTKFCNILCNILFSLLMFCAVWHYWIAEG